jgi:hypothetical protein
MGQKFANNVLGSLTSNMSAVVLSFTIDPTKADDLPALTPGDWFYAVIQKLTGEYEIVKVQKRDVGSNACQNIVRAQQGTTALNFTAGQAVVALRATAADFQAMIDHIEAHSNAHVASAIGFTPDDEFDSANVADAIHEVLAKARDAIADAAEDKVKVADLIAQTFTCFTTAGASPAYTLTPEPPIAAYADNQRFQIKTHAASADTGNTLNVSGKGAKALKRYDPVGAKVDVTFGANQLLDVVYDGADFVIVSGLASYEPACDYHFSPLATKPPGTRRLLVQGQAVDLTLFPSLAPLWCGVSKNNTADFYYRCLDPNAPSTTRNSAGTFLKLPPPGYFLRVMNAGATGWDANRSAFNLQGAEVGSFGYRIMSDDGDGSVITDGYRSITGIDLGGQAMTANNDASANNWSGYRTVTVTPSDTRGVNWPIYVWLSY